MHGDSARNLPDQPSGGLVIDCDTCTVRGDACGDCVVTVMLDLLPGPIAIDDTEVRALDVLGSSGLVPRLRMTSD